MWYLTSENDSRVIYVVSPTQEITIGRSTDNQVCNFAIPDDPSISRKHATLSITEHSLFLVDLGSRYGTFINDSTDKVEINTNIRLKENDIVKFGKMNSIWRVSSICLYTCTSTLKGENLHKLKLILNQIGGMLKNEWDDTCNYLTMPAITLTIKVVLALVQGSHIVTTEFWSQFAESVKNFSAMPDPQKFTPQVVESTLNKEAVSFMPDSRRRSLFEDMKFVFFSRRQFELYKPVLIRSGATPLILGECKMSVSMLCEANVIVIQYVSSGATQETQTQRNQINDIVAQLKNKGKRVIADAEIGLAILYCSTKKYCNPNFSFTSEVVKQDAGPLSKKPNVLAQESQEPTFIKQEKENVRINETYASDDKQDADKLAAKRKLSEFTSEIQFNPNKKVATVCYVANVSNESNKRRLSDEETSSNLSKKMALENNDQGSSNSSEDILAVKDKSDDMFNFISSISTNNENKTKKLNLSRPQKRKVDASRDDEDLFNFVKKDDDSIEPEGESSKQNMFSSNKILKADNTDTPYVRNSVTITPEDISAMRGVKLKELMESNTMINSSPVEEFKVKKEQNDDLEDKMGGLDLGNTIVITCTNLIVKKEPFKIEPDTTTSCSVKNFKKFKKVWPVKSQVTVIHTMSMNLVDSDDTNTYSVAF
ncbi:nibrin [Anticarsia gemmatalis]|uniref:nibrin n=1 Tax=Anticarsia gemmatalis TaxID=129554 RepID=UPI003F759B6A